MSKSSGAATKKKQPAKKTIRKSGPARSAVARYPINGTGGIPRKTFGSNPGFGNPLLGLDATIPAHLTLPINVGPYTVIRTTTIINTAKRTVGFGFFRNSSSSFTAQSAGIDPPVSTIGSKEGWAPCVGFASGIDVGLTNPNNVPNVSTEFFGCPQLEQLGASATIAPAAMTVQIMDGNSMAGETAAKGILYIGVSKTQMRLKDSSDTWDKIGQDFVSYQAPRLCSGAKLALRGVKLSARPFNVQELMDFDIVLPMLEKVSGELTYENMTAPWNSSTVEVGDTAENSNMSLKGFAPIMVYNPNKEEIQVVVTCEWRVRFNYGHPAASTHQVHPASSTQAWDHVQRAFDRLGHGCIDIVEDVASRGMQAIAGAAVNRFAGSRGFPMIVD